MFLLCEQVGTMVEFNIKVHKQQRIAYFPKAITEGLGFEFKAVANRVALLLFPKNAKLEDVIKSLRLIEADLEHARELQMN
jgi:hypothetical protein